MHIHNLLNRARNTRKDMFMETGVIPSDVELAERLGLVESEGFQRRHLAVELHLDRPVRPRRSRSIDGKWFNCSVQTPG